MLLRVNVALGDVHIAVARQVSQRPRVHVRRPSGEPGMPQSILEARGTSLGVTGLFPEYPSRFRNCLRVLLLEAGKLDVATQSRRRKYRFPAG